MKWSFLFPHLIPNPTRSFDHNWDFPKAFWKESRRILIAAVLSLTASDLLAEVRVAKSISVNVKIDPN